MLRNRIKRKQCSFEETKRDVDIFENPWELDSSYNPLNYYTEGNNQRNRGLPILSKKNEKELGAFLSDNKNGGHASLRKNELQIALKLLQTQAKIMNNALDDIYFKTRQDIRDMQNIITSLSICSDGESSLDPIATKEIKI